MLVELCAEHAAYEGAEYDPRGKAHRLSLALFSDPPRLHAWVAERGGQAVGYATASREYSTWDAAEYVHMDCLYLREDARGLGIGRDLVRAVAELARGFGCGRVEWQTPEWNGRAIAFYGRAGAAGKRKVRFALRTEGAEGTVLAAGEAFRGGTDAG